MATPKAKTKAKATAKAKTAPKSKATAKSGATAKAKTTPKSKATAKAKAAVATTGGRVRVTQVRSSIGRLATHKACLGGLGLRRMHHTVEVADTPENRGMINRISYMVSVEEV